MSRFGSSEDNVEKDIKVSDCGTYSTMMRVDVGDYKRKGEKEREGARERERESGCVGGEKGKEERERSRCREFFA